jgi:ABC-type uncharacterized transport system, periplasmic component
MMLGASCAPKSSLPKVGYAQMFVDATLDKAKQGFFDALKEGGFENGKNIQVIERNAQGDNATLNQTIEYFISEKVALIATNPTIATIAAVQRTKEIPICMMVAPRPDLAGLTDEQGNAPQIFQALTKPLLTSTQVSRSLSKSFRMRSASARFTTAVSPTR